MNSSRPLRIAYLISKYPDFSHTFILREVLALRDRGFEIKVASINEPPPLEKLTKPEQQEAAQTFYIKRQGALGAAKAVLWCLFSHPAGLVRGFLYALRLAGADLSQLALYTFYFLEALILAKHLQANSLEHVHVHFATPASTVALILTRVTGNTFSMTVHGPDEFYDVTKYKLAEKLAAAKFVVCISHFAQSQLMKLTAPTLWSKFEIARLGVDTAHFAPDKEAHEDVQVLCVGRLVAAKGQRTLIEAMAKLRSEDHPLRLKLVGDGPERTQLEALIRERNLSEAVSFTGAVNQEQLQHHYRTADIFALASFAEGIPVVLMEAMAMEIPCVATSITGIPELISNGENGLLVAPSSVEGMADAIKQLLLSAELRRTLGQAGRECIQQQYALERNVDTLQEIFHRRLAP